MQFRYHFSKAFRDGVTRIVKFVLEPSSVVENQWVVKFTPPTTEGVNPVPTVIFTGDYQAAAEEYNNQSLFFRTDRSFQQILSESPPEVNPLQPQVAPQDHLRDIARQILTGTDSLSARNSLLAALNREISTQEQRNNLQRFGQSLINSAQQFQTRQMDSQLMAALDATIAMEQQVLGVMNPSPAVQSSGRSPGLDLINALINDISPELLSTEQISNTLREMNRQTQDESQVVVIITRLLERGEYRSFLNSLLRLPGTTADKYRWLRDFFNQLDEQQRQVLNNLPGAPPELRDAILNLFRAALRSGINESRVNETNNPFSNLDEAMRVRFSPGNRPQAPVTTVARRPQNNNQHIGVEIEFYCQLDRHTVLRKLVERMPIQKIHLKNDTSIQVPNVDDFYGHELTILGEESEIFDLVGLASEILIDLGARVNKSCGLHVHLDMRNNLNGRGSTLALKNIHTRLEKVRKLMFAMNPITRVNNSYCGFRKENFNDRRSDRYNAINQTALNKFGTIELRLHAGTVEKDKICNWIKFLLFVVKKNRGVQRMDSECLTANQWIEDFRVTDEALIEYVRARESKFLAEHTQNNTFRAAA